MSTSGGNYTNSYRLIKPSGTDLYNISVFNDNMDRIDKAISDNSIALTESIAQVNANANNKHVYLEGKIDAINNDLLRAIQLLRDKISEIEAKL